MKSVAKLRARSVSDLLVVQEAEAGQHFTRMGKNLFQNSKGRCIEDQQDSDGMHNARSHSITN